MDQQMTREQIEARILEIKKLKLKIYKEQPYRFLSPIGKMEEFLDEALSGKYLTAFMSSANGTGKTTTIVGLIANLCFPNDNPFFQQPVIQDWKWLKRGRIVSDTTTIKETIIPMMEEMIPKKHYTRSKAGKEFWSKWKMRDDKGNVVFEWDLMTYEQDPKQFESANLGICLTGDSRVLLSSGEWKEIRDVQEGDEVVSYGAAGYEEKSGRMPRKQVNQKVIKKRNNGIKKVWEIETLKGFRIKATEDHRFYVAGKGWIPLKDVKVGDKLVVKEHDIDGEDNVSLDYAFLLGLWIGDGWCDKSVYFSCANDHLLSQVSGMVERIAHKKRYDYRIVEKGFKKLLKETGLLGHKAYNKFIPDLIFRSNDKIVSKFLEGLYASDGWFTKGAIGYGTTSKRLAEDLQLLLRRFNITAGIYPKKSQKEGYWKEQWFVLISKAIDTMEFCSRVSVSCKEVAQGKTLKLAKERFFSKTDRIDNLNTPKSRKRVKVRKIQYIGEEEVFDIQVGGHHNYLANGLLTHNCIFDEPPPFSIYTASIARLKQGGICLIFATPLGSNIGSAWLYEKIVSDPNREAKDFFYMTASKEDGCLEHGVRGFLPHEQIEREMKQYPEEEILPRIFGEFSQVKGRVIKEYDEKIHVLDQIFDVNKEDYAVVQLWDTHARVNEAIMWVAINRSGTAFIVDELWIDAGLDEMVAKIKEIDSRYRVVKRLIDPSAFNVDKRIELTGKYGDIKGVSFAQILHEKYGLKYEPASKRRADGITMIREALRYNFQAGSWVQYPTLFVFPHCTRTRWEFINWMWDDWRGVTAERKDPRDKPQDKNDHMMENLGRFFLEGTTFTEPVEEVMKVDRSAIVEERTYF